MPRVIIPPPLQGPTRGQGEVKVEGATIRECLEAVETDYKGFLAQVVRPDGTAINGLYAAGNSSAAVTGSFYPGAGGTIGPAMTYGYIAALHAAGRLETA